jgi:hypothetical protein
MYVITNDVLSVLKLLPIDHPLPALLMHETTSRRPKSLLDPNKEGLIILNPNKTSKQSGEGKGAGTLKAPPYIGFASDPSLLTLEHG